MRFKSRMLVLPAFYLVLLWTATFFPLKDLAIGSFKEFHCCKMISYSWDLFQQKDHKNENRPGFRIVMGREGDDGGKSMTWNMAKMNQSNKDKEIVRYIGWVARLLSSKEEKAKPIPIQTWCSVSVNLTYFIGLMPRQNGKGLPLTLGS